MTSLHRVLRRLPVPTLAVSLCSPSLHARPNGFAAECGGCHYGELEGGGRAPSPIVTAVAAASRVEPGDQVDITVSVESAWSEALVAGFLILTDANSGVFTPVEEGTGNVGLMEEEMLDYAIGHTAARELVDGGATFRASWTAPATTGSYDFAVYAVTSDDGDGVDDPGAAEEINDPFGKFAFKIAVGCDLVSYFFDGDMDGYGAEEELFCDPPTGYLLQGGDCRDDDPAVNPGAVELCSFVDENCDGDAMAPPTFYLDVDGDGYGEASEILVDTCTQPDGYAAEPDDCAPTDPAVHPGAVELPDNGIDDNCNGMIDEPGPTPPDATGEATGVVPPVNAPLAPQMPSASGASNGVSPDTTGGVAPDTSGATGVPAPASGTAPAVDPAMDTDTGGANASGCGVALPRGGNTGLWAGFVLFCAGLGRRRRSAVASRW